MSQDIYAHKFSEKMKIMKNERKNKKSVLEYYPSYQALKTYESKINILSLNPYFAGRAIC